MNDYRYVLRRNTGLLSGSGRALFVMLNPSTADDVRDDPTIRRLKGFATREGWRGFNVVNLFAARATDPEELLTFHDPRGPRNDAILREEIGASTFVIAAWGAPPAGPKGILGALHRVRVSEVLALCPGEVEWFCLGTTADGSPRHPLYVKRDACIVRWTPREAARG